MGQEGRPDHLDTGVIEHVGQEDLDRKEILLSAVQDLLHREGHLDLEQVVGLQLQDRREMIVLSAVRGLLHRDLQPP